MSHHLGQCLNIRHFSAAVIRATCMSTLHSHQHVICSKAFISMGINRHQAGFASSGTSSHSAPLFPLHSISNHHQGAGWFALHCHTWVQSNHPKQVPQNSTGNKVPFQGPTKARASLFHWARFFQVGAFHLVQAKARAIGGVPFQPNPQEKKGPLTSLGTTTWVSFWERERPFGEGFISPFGFTHRPFSHFTLDLPFPLEQGFYRVNILTPNQGQGPPFSHQQVWVSHRERGPQISPRNFGPWHTRAPKPGGFNPPFYFLPHKTIWPVNGPGTGTGVP